MAYSLRLVYDLDADEAVRGELLSLLKETAAYGLPHALENGKEEIMQEARQKAEDIVANAHVRADQIK